MALTKPEGKVFDPYMGVGSAVTAASMHGRVGYGCDIVEKYVEIAWERFHALRGGTLRTRPMNKPVYDPTKPYGGHKGSSHAGDPTLPFPMAAKAGRGE